MSRYLISQYQAEIEKIVRFGGSKKETSIRSAFQRLLGEYVKQKDFLLITELDYKTKLGTIVYPDGTVKDALRMDWGYWESKDEYDDLNEEIAKKLAKGYPDSNILFEDTREVVLIQEGQEIMRASMQDAEKLDKLLNVFTHYERPEVENFHKAVKHFQEDLPVILKALREMIKEQDKNPSYTAARDRFLQICRDSINPEITAEDIREMMIQHILTEEIFVSIFDEPHFHRENNIAHELSQVLETFFNRAEREKLLARIGHYYSVIKSAAANIANHKEKQTFLKTVYEHFYKSYNPKAADTLGIIYTPNEIVRFMVESVDFLLQKHFDGKILADENVEILDPATGTGTFITEIIDYLPDTQLKLKYKNEIHANEVAILPYYIANLNIEFTYKQKTGEYAEFQNICFVDTLENVHFGASGSRNQQGFNFGFSGENSSRIERQNQKKISVIIGNPPYNANQRNENENNKNKVYEDIDKRIKETYIKNSTAQKTKQYDMYVRFFRWASDRLADNGILAFITNNSFIDAKGFDGFRKVAAQEFNTIYVINLKGNAYTSGERRKKEGGNVFNDQIRVGVAIYFMVKNEQETGCKIFYNEIEDYVRAEEKKSYLHQNKLQNLEFRHIVPDKNNNWINISESDFEDLLPLANKATKLAKNPEEERAIFKLFSNGVVTSRDEWVYDFDKKFLMKKVEEFFTKYEEVRKKIKGGNFEDNELKMNIKWSRDLKKNLRKNRELQFSEFLIRNSLYRPFIRKLLYFDPVINEMQYQLPQIFPRGDEIENKIISFNGSNNAQWNVIATKYTIDFNALYGGAQSLPLYRYNEAGDKTENITNWGLQQFQNHYKNKQIKKKEIFHYVYAVLSNPDYQQKYISDLKRELPRIPFYDDFYKWAKFGKKLMDLHINFESAEKYPLQRKDQKIKGKVNKPKLKADKLKGEIFIDEATMLSGIPPEAWEYKLGNRSALEWVLDQYQERKPKDPTVMEKFNTYRFADYKEQVIDLLAKVCTVSIETVRVLKSMQKID